MINKKKIISIILVLMIGMLVTSCGSNNGNNSKDKNSSVNEESSNDSTNATNDEKNNKNNSSNISDDSEKSTINILDDVNAKRVDIDNKTLEEIQNQREEYDKLRISEVDFEGAKQQLNHINKIEIDKIDQVYKVDLAKIDKDYQNKKEKITLDYNNSVKKINDDYTAELNKIQQNYKSEIDKIDKNYSMSLEKLKQQYSRNDIIEISDKIRELKSHNLTSEEYDYELNDIKFKYGAAVEDIYKSVEDLKNIRIQSINKASESKINSEYNAQQKKNESIYTIAEEKSTKELEANEEKSNQQEQVKAKYESNKAFREKNLQNKLSNLDKIMNDYNQKVEEAKFNRDKQIDELKKQCNDKYDKKFKQMSVFESASSPVWQQVIDKEAKELSDMYSKEENKYKENIDGINLSVIESIKSLLQ